MGIKSRKLKSANGRSKFIYYLHTKTYCTSNNQNQKKKGGGEEKKGVKENVRDTLLETKHVVYTE